MDYLLGSDVLGAAPVTPQIVTISVKNAEALIAKEAGAFGTGVAVALAPQALNNFFYEMLRKKLADNLAKEGVVADVRVVPDTLAPPQPEPSKASRFVAMGASFVLGALVGGIAMRRR